jgi:hypothetical protein
MQYWTEAYALCYKILFYTLQVVNHLPDIVLVNNSDVHELQISNKMIHRDRYECFTWLDMDELWCFCLFSEPIKM